MKASTPREIGAVPGPINFAYLERHFGLTRQDVYTLALMEALAIKYHHQPRQTSPTTWEIDSRSEPGTVRHQWVEGNRILCDCPAAQPADATNRKPRFCSHTSAVHLWLCQQQGKQPLVRPMPPDVLRYDPSPEAKTALALIAYSKPKAQPERAPVLAEVQP